MKTIILPEKARWEELCRRPEIDRNNLITIIKEIFDRVKSESDAAVTYYTEKFEGISVADIKVSQNEIKESAGKLTAELKNAIKAAAKNIESFHKAQVIHEPVTETVQGVKCWRKSVGIEKVGLYIPGGSAPLFSTLLMLGIPAKIAGCSEIVVCTPVGKDGKVNPVILYTADLIGITDIFKAGGAQAIAAMAYGTKTIPKVYKIFGPGNQYVTKAKELIQQDGVAIDMPAGPSEVLVIADKNADPVFVAADLLSQCEHGPDSQAIMLTNDQVLIERVSIEVNSQLQVLPRKDIARNALGNSKLILLTSLSDCMDFSNIYAPEHLIINTIEPDKLAKSVRNAGSVFLGRYTCESAGDYASGTNHTLPTNGYAKNYSGVSVDSFVRKISFQEIDDTGIKNLGQTIEILAEAESLAGHKNAVSVRLKSLGNV